MAENNLRAFDLGSILTITTGRMFTKMSNLYDILNYLTNDEIYTHQIPRVMKVAQTYVLSIYPQLKGVGEDIVINGWEDLETFLDSQRPIFGDLFTLNPMPKEICEHIDPIKEAKDIASSKII